MASVSFCKMNVCLKMAGLAQHVLLEKRRPHARFELKSFCFPSFLSGPPSSRSRLPMLLAGLLCACSSAWFKTVLENAALLGMNREQLAPALVDARPVRSPRRLSSGALGAWRVPDMLCEGAHFEQTLFFVQQKLAQMDLVLLQAHSGPGSGRAVTATYTALLQSLRARLGPELASSASTPQALMDTASWVSAGADVMLFRFGKPDHPGLRMVIRQRRLVDASEL